MRTSLPDTHHGSSSPEPPSSSSPQDYDNWALRRRRGSDARTYRRYAARDPGPVWLPYPDDVNALLPSLWSDNVTKTDDGVLTIAGRSVTELAAEYGTPTLIMDAADFRSRAQAYASTFANAFSAEKGLAGADVYYAGKAFLCTAVARWVHEAGLG